MTPVFGLLTDKIGRRPVHFAGFAFAAVLGVTMFPLLDTESPVAIVAVAVIGLSLSNAATTAPSARSTPNCSAPAPAAAARRWATSSARR